MISVKVKNISENLLPNYAHIGDACMDIRSAVDIDIYPERIELVSTGLFFEIPEGYVIKLYPRSGLSTKGVNLANCVGVIDSNFREEVKVIIKNNNTDIFNIKKGDRIAQMEIQKVMPFELELVEEIDASSHRTGGFGSSGK